MDYKKYNQANSLNWDQRTKVHIKSKFYNLENFRKDPHRVKRIDQELLGEVAGKKILHLACHLGLESLSLQKQDAIVTGVDISQEAIKAAQQFANELNLKTRFIVSDVYDLKDNLTDTDYDIVYISCGVLCWLYDLKKLFQIAAYYLKPGGAVIVVDDHPTAYMFNEDLQMKENYYFQNGAPKRYRADGSYADRNDKTITEPNYQWSHTISDIINSAISAGLTIECFDEYPFACWPMFKNMQKKSDGYYHLEQSEGFIPMLFALKAIKK